MYRQNVKISQENNQVQPDQRNIHNGGTKSGQTGLDLHLHHLTSQKAKKQ